MTDRKFSTDTDEAPDLAALESDERLARLRDRLSRPHQGTLESLAAKYGLTLSQATECLPAGNRTHFPGSRMVEILGELADWGEVLLLINNDDGVFECKGTIPRGSLGHGYYNLGGGSPISGHLRYEACRDIYCVRRSFKKKDTCSIQFFNQSGAAMFKIFLGRDAAGQILPDQLKRFEALSQLSAEA